MRAASIVEFLREVYAQWRKDNALTLGAALAFYALFSMAPLLVLIIAIAGLVLGHAAAQGELVGAITGAVGPDAARVLQEMIVRASAPASGALATAIGLLTMLGGASGVFGQLQASLNHIWEVEPAAGGMRRALRQRLASFGLILGIGSMLLLSLVVSAALAAVSGVLATYPPLLSLALPALNFSMSFVMVTALFAMIYKLLPDARMHWRDVWAGAAVTALLFTIGKSLIGIYLGRAGKTSVYGAAASLVLVLLWVYYSSQLLLLGAEFTEVYSRMYGSRRTLGGASGSGQAAP